jgi:hypothetical protein
MPICQRYSRPESLILGTGDLEAGAAEGDGAGAGGYAGEANATSVGCRSPETHVGESGKPEEAAKTRTESWDDDVSDVAEVQEKSMAAFPFTCGADENSFCAQAGPEAANKNTATERSFFILPSWRIDAQSRDKAFPVTVNKGRPSCPRSFAERLREWDWDRHSQLEPMHWGKVVLGLSVRGAGSRRSCSASPRVAG